MFCKRWEQEDLQLSPVERTKRAIHGTMMDLENFLKFTMETGEEFEGGWLPTLDTKLRVEMNNRVLYTHYEKPVASNTCVLMDSAMDENSKIQILANDLTRRLLHIEQAMGMEEQVRVINEYSQKLFNSGYKQEQVTRIIINGIKAFERRLKESTAGGRPLHSTSKESYGRRSKKKLTEKTSWYKKSKKRTEEHEGVHRKRRGSRDTSGEELRTKTVLFVEQTRGGTLAKMLREVMARIETMIGFRIKIVERAGTSLRNTLPNKLG